MSGSAKRDESRPAGDASALPRDAVGSNMLEQILSARTAGTPDTGFVEPADVRALEAVAKKLAGRPFALEPVAFELVYAMLEVQFVKAGLGVDTLRAMAEQVAATLYDDPASRERLHALWRELSGS